MWREQEAKEKVERARKDQEVTGASKGAAQELFEQAQLQVHSYSTLIILPLIHCCLTTISRLLYCDFYSSDSVLIITLLPFQRYRRCNRRSDLRKHRERLTHGITCLHLHDRLRRYVCVCLYVCEYVRACI
jgi:hypothetical protein